MRRAVSNMFEQLGDKAKGALGEISDGIAPVQTRDYPALGFDPAPGTVPTVTSLATDFSRVASSLGDAYQTLTSVGRDGSFWQGEAAQNFHAKLGELPGYLDKAHRSLGDAAKTLDEWASDLNSLQRTATDYEAQAQQALQRLNQAKQNPDLKLAGHQFDNEQDLANAQRRLNAAAAELNEAGRELDEIRDLAKRLRTQHQGLVSEIAAALRRAKEEAPEEPGLLERVGEALAGLVDGLKDVANQVWNFVKSHANLIAALSDVISDVSAVLGVAGLCLDALPPVGEILGVISSGLSAVALVGHVTAKAAGADVPWETIAADGIGVVSLGIGGAAAKAGKAGVDALEAFCKGAGVGAAIDGLGIPFLGKYLGHDGSSTIVDDFNSYWKPRNAAEAAADALIPGFAVGDAFYRAVEEGNKKDQQARGHH